jgi:endonuclease III
MPRKSPRSRRKPDPEPRLPGKRRPRATPGRTRSSRRGSAARATRMNGHPPLGAREVREARSKPAGALVKGARIVKSAVAPPGSARRPTLRTRPGTGKRPRFRRPDPERARAIIDILSRTYPDATTALRFENPLQLLIATILSAQCTDARVNQVTPVLFARYPTAEALAGADRAELEKIIQSTGFFRNKAKSILSCTADIVSKHGGRVPATLEELTALQGVGRKTANVVLGNAFGIPGVVVDTHVQRLSRRLGLSREQDPVRIEFDLMKILPRETWTQFSHWLILHGRRICIARKPRCSICPLLPHCPRIGVTVSV